MNRNFILPALALTAAFASTAIAATVTSDQARTQDSAVETQTQDAQESVNGSMTDTNLSGNVDEDTSALSTGTTSGTTSGAIVDQTERKKVKKTKKKKKHTDSSEETTTEPAPAAPLEQ